MVPLFLCDVMWRSVVARGCPAVDDEGLPGHIARIVRGEKGNDSGDFFQAAPYA